MSVSGILLGLVNILIIVVILLLIGAIGKWILGMLGFGPPGDVERLYLALVALIALYLIVALLFGLPTVHIIRGTAVPPLPAIADWQPNIMAPER